MTAAASSPLSEPHAQICCLYLYCSYPPAPHTYLTDIEQQTQDLFLRLVKEYADRQGVTEQLKAENQLEWVGKMNNIRSRAVEIIDVELICV